MHKDTIKHAIETINNDVNNLVFLAFVGVFSLAFLIIGLIGFFIWWLV